MDEKWKYRFLHLETMSKSGGNYFLDEGDDRYLDGLVTGFLFEPY